MFQRLKSWLGGYTYRYHCNFYKNYKIGRGTKIGSFCDIGGIIGKNCLIQSFTFIPYLTTVEDNVFIGPGVEICNDKYPPSNNLEKVIIKKGASIGAGAIILPGIKIGRDSLVGAGSVVTQDVCSNCMVIGNPAREKLNPKK